MADIAAQIGYKCRPARYGGKPAVTAENTLDRKFEVGAPDTVWVTDITYIKTLEGWLFRKRRLRPIDFSVAVSGFGGGSWGDELVGESRMSS